MLVVTAHANPASRTTLIVSASQPPNEADLIELLYRATHDDAERQRILVDNPAKLFGFT